MDFRFTAAEDALREEVRAFVKEEWHDLWGGKGWHLDDVANCSFDLDAPDVWDAVRTYRKRIVEKGWWTMNWPREYGGQDVPLSTVLAYMEEMGYQGSPAALSSVPMVYRSLMLYGTPWQKGHFLPAIAQADVEIALGLSEPNAGSDLANVETRAVHDGDEYVLNGTKSWSSTAHHSQWILLLTRTDPELPKHRGLSVFLVPLDHPGITMRPIHDMMGRHRWNQEFFQDARIPARYRIGEENRGWYVVMEGLQADRATFGGTGSILRLWEEMVACARTYRVDGGVLADSTLVRRRLADMRVELEAVRVVSYNAVWEHSRGDVTGRSASMVRTWGGELHQRMHRSFAQMLGMPATVLPHGASWVPFEGYAGANALLASGRTIGHGSKEISRNIIAQRGLGLPR